MPFQADLECMGPISKVVMAVELEQGMGDCCPATHTRLALLGMWREKWE